MDIRTASRTFAAASLIIGPLAFAIPVNFTEADSKAAEQLRVTSHHLGLANLSNTLLLAEILLVPAMIYAARLARKSAPRLAFIGGGLSALAWIAGLISLGGLGVVFYYGARQTDQSAAATLLDKASNDPVIGTLTLLFVLGHLIGMIILGVALWRSRAIPAWAGIMFTLFPLVHLGAHIGGSVVVDDLSALLLLIPAIVCAVTILRMRNDDWDLPTATAAPAVPAERSAVPVA